MGFVLEYWLGGTATMSLATIAAALGGVHLLIGVGEGIIAATTVITVAKVRPDLVYGLLAARGRERSRQVAPASAGMGG